MRHALKGKAPIAAVVGAEDTGSSGREDIGEARCAYTRVRSSPAAAERGALGIWSRIEGRILYGRRAPRGVSLGAQGRAGIARPPAGLRGHARVRSLRGYDGAKGQVFQEAYFAATDFITSSVSPIALVEAMLRAFDLLAAKGIALIHPSEGVGFPRDLDVGLVRTVARGARNPIAARVFFQTMDIAKARKRGLPRIGGCFATALDGCFGSVDAALNEPYANDASNRGILYYSQERVDAFVAEAEEAGLQVAMHAIGDAAFDQAVTAFERALSGNGRDAGVSTGPSPHDNPRLPAHPSRARESGRARALRTRPNPRLQRLAPGAASLPRGDTREARRAPQPAPDAPPRGPDRQRVDRTRPAPCPTPSPASTRPATTPTRRESIDVMEAIRLFTIDAARLSFDEVERGSLEAGKVADMVILDRDPSP